MPDECAKFALIQNDYGCPVVLTQLAYYRPTCDHCKLSTWKVHTSGLYHVQSVKQYFGVVSL